MLAGPASSAQASCAALESPDPFAEVEQSSVAFIGTAGDGALSEGALVSPAVFTVEHRLDRWRRTRERVRTEITRDPSGVIGWSGNSVSIRPGQRWLFLGERRSGQVSATTCAGAFNTIVDGTAPPTLRFPGLTTSATPAWSDTRGQRLGGEDGPVVVLPHRARALRGAGSTAARLVHRGRVRTLHRSKGWWRYPSAVATDQVVVATKNGFWGAVIR